jgi:hypothetical protein
MKQLLQQIVGDDNIHCKFLNTLSLLENTGARKISASEHPLTVNLIILKHAAEEARHAYYLKKQIDKIIPDYCTDYSFQFLLAPITSYHYLKLLDHFTSAYIKKELKLSGAGLVNASYLLVTYAIEMRADQLYPLYQEVLDEAKHKVNVKSIIAEETGHLEEMTRALKGFSTDWALHADIICKAENGLFDKWVQGLEASVHQIQNSEIAFNHRMTGSI